VLETNMIYHELHGVHDGILQLYLNLTQYLLLYLEPTK